MATAPIVPNVIPGQQAPLVQSQALIPGGPPATAQAATSMNSFMPPGTTPGAVPQTNNINWNDGNNTVLGDFKDTYGGGTGTAITQALQGLGTTTSGAVQATIANTGRVADKQFGNIQAHEAAAGVTPNSSTAALAAGDFYGDVNSSLQSTIGNMELSQEQQLIASLTGEGQAHGTDSSFMGTLGKVLSGNESMIGALAGDTANAINSTAASGTGGFSAMLSAIGMLA